MATSVTPMMKQYLTIKEQHEDALLFFRLGDFYELFYDDAVTASKVLEITLTSRDKKKDPIPMCGVPHHSARNYIAKLIDNGYKVAICEQMEDPREVKGMVKRDVVRVITPGTLIDDFGMEDGRNNYLLALYEEAGLYSAAYADISTGELYAFSTSDEDELRSEVERVEPSEIVVDEGSAHLLGMIYNDPPLYTVYGEAEAHDVEKEEGVSEDEALNLLLSYISANNMKSLIHFRPVRKHSISGAMKLNHAAISNLELLSNLQTKKEKGSLFWYLNRTETPMGKRKLRSWIERPLMNISEIKARHDVVNIFLDNFIERADLIKLLNQVYDIERLVGRLSFGNIDAKDLIQIRDSLEGLPAIRDILTELGLLEFPIFKGFDALEDLHRILDDSLLDPPPKTVRDGNIFKSEYDEKLSELRYIQDNARSYLNEYLEAERERTGIKNIKIGFNKVFGYFIEISKVNAMNFDAEKFDYSRKQTLTNAERFITPELKEMETRILTAEDESIVLEYRLFTELRKEMEAYMERLQKTAEMISTLDCLLAFAEVSNTYRLTEPEFDREKFEVEDGRHPVVEKVIGENTYVPNDLKMDEGEFIYLITGPNMSGKSTYMRQVAIISIMAQMGMFVPAKRAVLPIFDAIFTRIGASDDLSSGKSTFMIEMMEANEALRKATKDSLLIFDEIGRGTSTYDGMALAESMLVYIHNFIGARTLFSTHYHELTRLDAELAGLGNYHVKATEYDGKLVFLHKVKPGAVEKSYGIHVAQLAELPEEVTSYAREKLAALESGRTSGSADVYQLELPLDDLETAAGDRASDVVQALKAVDVNTLTPLEGLQKLSELTSMVKDDYNE
ncbi:DNA mismatch repair protein MutS [Salinicoccus halitifaciens]|uniref:DNA mismatch repair protein MutS n=1 Tax=Salinicoccus halitifaciens TaxID=1073415 RepID=A0ABV2E739_9STAP|nr:DNA mismatch repair protein MutS [Salinicoccus halitifaciens]MCD2136703.1 DNA mismatch repair protein MutS [Salinicoccus halitifaciens]